MRRLTSLALLGASASLGLACDDGPQTAPTGTDADDADLRRFELADDEHPEVGKLWIRREDGGAICTATLLGPSTIVTAAHCFEFDSGVFDETLARFTIQPSNGATAVSFPIHRAVSLGSKLQVGADIAVAQLDYAVPPELAVPAPLASEWPDGDDDMTVYGYGTFGTRCEHELDGHKRKWTTSVGGALRALSCPGDSGGPFFHDDTGSIIAVVKGDFLGLEWVWSAVRHRDWIAEQLAASERGELGDATD